MPARRPNNAVTLRTYKDLERYLRAFADGHFHLLIILGSPGLQKSRLVHQVLGRDVCWLEGNVTAFLMYCLLYEHKDMLVVMDDLDGLHKNPNAVRLLKCLCQTEAEKSVAWQTDAKRLDREGIPRQFRTSSRLIIIANEWETLSQNVAALQDRGHVLFFEPSSLEVHLRTAEWFWDQEVFDFIADHLHLIDRPSMRQYVHAWELKRAGMDWRGPLLERWLDGPRLLVARLKADCSFASEEERAAVFVEQGGGCRATYFNHARKIGVAAEVPRVALRGQPPEDLDMRSRVLPLARQTRRRSQTC